LERDVEQHGGRIVDWYGGQEHATPGYERKQIERLLVDARRGRFDAVIVAHADRWSRDNVQSTTGLEVLKAHGIRFFVGMTEYNLHCPEHVLFLGMSAVVGQFYADNQNQKSLLNKIARTKRNVPCSGSLPFGRNFKEGEWGVIEEVKTQMEDIRDRILAGESISAVANLHGIPVTTLYERLKNCGPTWMVEFHSKKLNIHESVPMDVPPLLDDESIQAIRKQIEANTTFHHGHLKYWYLFSRMVFCCHCGSAFSGQSNNGVRYYRHLPKSQKTCPFKGHVRADDLESSVIRHLFECFGNPVAVQRAIEEAIPDSAQADEDKEQLNRLNADVVKIQKGRQQIINLILEGTLTEKEAAPQLDASKHRLDLLSDQCERLREALANVPSPEMIQAVAGRMSTVFKARHVSIARLNATTRALNTELAEMTWEDQRALVEMVFGGITTDGYRMGVYVDRIEGQRKWRYAIRGNLIHEFGMAPSVPNYDPEHGYGYHSDGNRQKALLTKLSVVTTPGRWAPIRRRKCCRLCRSRRRGGG